MPGITSAAAGTQKKAEDPSKKIVKEVAEKAIKMEVKTLNLAPDAATAKIQSGMVKQTSHPALREYREVHKPAESATSFVLATTDQSLDSGDGPTVWNWET